MMLATRRSTRACHSCRLQLLNLYQYGFVQNSPRAFRSPSRINTHRALSLPVLSSRTFATTFRRQQVSQNGPFIEDQTPEELETVVRRAKKTFGDTLPRDYLSPDEYLLYERLYGPPSGETKSSDLESLLGVDMSQIPGARKQNIMIRENEAGEREEFSYDSSLGFEVTREAGAQDQAGLHGQPGSSYDPGLPEVNPASTEAATDMPPEPAQHTSQSSDIDHVTDLIQSEASSESNAPLVVSRKGFLTSQRPEREEVALMKLYNELREEIASMPQEEELDDEDDVGTTEHENDEEDQEDDMPDGSGDVASERYHPHTLTARSSTRPSTMMLAKEFTDPIEDQITHLNMKHLKTAAEQALGGAQLPYSPSTPARSKTMRQMPVALDPTRRNFSDMDANVFLTSVMPQTFTAVMHTLVEIRRRLGKDWLRDQLRKSNGKEFSILDVGGGGAGACAWNDIVRTEWEMMNEDGIVTEQDPPPSKVTVITAPDSLRHKISRFLDNTTFLPRLPDYLHVADEQPTETGEPYQPRKSFDLIIASHSLWPLKENHRRKNMVMNLWKMLKPEGGVLVLIEKGVPRGFEAIAGARDALLKHHLGSSVEQNVEAAASEDPSDSIENEERSGGMIIAPCTNHAGCPMYPIPGESSGRKDYCHFFQRFHRPQFLQRLMGESSANHEDVKFSYLAVQKGHDARQGTHPVLQDEAAATQAFQGYEHIDLPASTEEGAPNTSDPERIRFNALSLPRLILPPLKRHGHVTLDVCTPLGTLERWTVPKSFSRLAYHDARKSKWGDLWALGAKTRVLRAPRLGRKADRDVEVLMGRLRSRKGGKGQGVMGPRTRVSPKTNKFDLLVGDAGYTGVKQNASQGKYLGMPERRTKGGRKVKPQRPVSDEDLG